MHQQQQERYPHHILHWCHRNKQRLMGDHPVFSSKHFICNIQFQIVFYAANAPFKILPDCSVVTFLDIVQVTPTAPIATGIL